MGADLQMTTILKIENLSKTFRSHWTFRPIEALKNVSLEVRAGESFGFLGHNGAGKTTVMKLIVGLLKANQGRILIEGKELTTIEQRSSLGYLPELPYFYDHLTVGETLQFFASLHGITGKRQRARVQELLALVNLQDRQHHNMRSLSKGLQQRVGIAQAIINRPRLLLLDEPFSGLDPLGRKEIRELILSLRREGATIFLSSHILSDVEDICDRVSIMSRGELKKVFSLTELPQLLTGGFELAITTPAEPQPILQLLEQMARSHTITASATKPLSAFFFDKQEDANRALHKALEAGLVIEKFGPISSRLEDVFVQVTEGAR